MVVIFFSSQIEEAVAEVVERLRAIFVIKCRVFQYFRILFRRLQILVLAVKCVAILEGGAPIPLSVGCTKEQECENKNHSPFLVPSFENQYFCQQAEQPSHQRVLIAALVAVEYRLVKLVFLQVFEQRGNVVDAVAAVHIDTLSSFCNIFQHLFIQLGNNHISLPISSETAIVPGNGSSLGRAQSDGTHTDALFRCLFGCPNSIIFMVFSVGNDNDGSPVVGLPLAFFVTIAECRHRFPYGLADGGSLSGNHAAVDLLEKEFCRIVVVGQGHLDETRSGKYYQAHSVSRHGIQQVRHHLFAPR